MEICAKVDGSMSDERAALSDQLNDLGFPPLGELTVEERTQHALEELDDLRRSDRQQGQVIGELRGKLVGRMK